MARLVIFGLGPSARAFVRRVRPRFASIMATVRHPEQALPEPGVEIVGFDSEGFDPRLMEAVIAADAVLVSVPPDEWGDPVLEWFGDTLQSAKALSWLGYLSTIGVYGDWKGDWVDESTPVAARGSRSIRRIMAEQAWQALALEAGLPVHLFRLAGIYGPHQNVLLQLQRGTAKRVIKPGQVFNRIHVEDIARVLEASLQHPRPMAIYNVSDGHPCPPQEVVSFAAGLMGVEPPPEVPFDEAQMSEMARSFYADNKRVSNRLIREELGVTLAYPTYREGLQALWQALQAA